MQTNVSSLRRLIINKSMFFGKLNFWQFLLEFIENIFTTEQHLQIVQKYYQVSFCLKKCHIRSDGNPQATVEGAIEP